MKESRAVYLSFVLEANDDGYLASAPGIQGAFAEGETIEHEVGNLVWTRMNTEEHGRER